MIKFIKKIVNNNFLSILLALFLAGYSKLIDKNIPDFLVKLFKNDLFRIFLIFCVIYSYKNNHNLSLFLVLILTYTLNIIYNNDLKEKYRVELYN